MDFTFKERATAKIVRTIPVHPVRSRLTTAVASISFDDIPHSAASIGAPILEQANLLGTFYVCGGYTGENINDQDQHKVSDIVALHKAGHEIAGHTFSHPNVTHISNKQRGRDCDANTAFINKALGGYQLTSFAYPYGAVSLDAKSYYAGKFLSCRGIHSGVNKGLMDFSELRAVSIEHQNFNIDKVRTMIDKAKAKNGWLIFYTHDVGPNPSAYGCTPQELEMVVEALLEAGIETLPVKDAAAKVLLG